MKQLHEAYSKWFKSLIQKYYYHHDIDSILGLEEWLENNCYFGTMTFDHKNVEEEKSSLKLGIDDFSIEIDNMKYAVKYLQKSLPKNKLPMIIASLDFQDSKYSGLGIGQRRNPHFHILYFCHPETHDLISSRIRSARFRYVRQKTMHTDRIRFDLIDTEKLKKPNAVSYGAKSHTKTVTNPLSSDTLFIFNQPGVESNIPLSINKYENKNRYINILKRKMISARKEYNNQNIGFI